MPTSPTSFLSEILEGTRIPLGKRAYFQERLRNRVYDLIVTEFLRMSEKTGLTQKELGKRVGKGPDQINRWMSSPGNWTLDTVSDLLLGIAGAELEIAITPLAARPKRNSHKPAWSARHDSLITYSVYLTNETSASTPPLSIGNKPLSAYAQISSPATAVSVGVAQ